MPRAAARSEGAAEVRSARRAGAVVAFTIIAVAVSVSASTGASTPAKAPSVRNPDYVGKLIGSPDGQIRLKLLEEFSAVSVGFRNLEDVCEGGTETVTSGTGSSGPRRDGRFDGISIQEPELSVLDYGIRVVQGRISPSGERASGFIFGAYDPDDPAGGSFNADECWTDGLVRFRAKAVRGSPPHDDRPAPGPDRKGSHDDRRGSYTGSLGSRREPVSLKVSGRGRNTRARFEGTLIVSCELGLSRRETAIGPVRVPVRKDGRFRYAKFTQDPISLDRTFTRIYGELKPDGRATGYVSSLFDPWDPAGDTNESECSQPSAGWRAKRGS